MLTHTHQCMIVIFIWQNISTETKIYLFQYKVYYNRVYTQNYVNKPCTQCHIIITFVITIIHNSVKLLHYQLQSKYKHVSLRSIDQL